MVNCLELQAVIDSGATLSAVSSPCIPANALRRTNVVPIQVGSGETIYSLGETTLVLSFGNKAIQQKAVVIDTAAFQAVLGTDFLSNPRVGGLITQPDFWSMASHLCFRNPWLPQTYTVFTACSKNEATLWWNQFENKFCKNWKFRSGKLLWIFSPTIGTTKKHFTAHAYSACPFPVCHMTTVFYPNASELHAATGFPY